MEFQEFQTRIPDSPTVRRQRFSLLGCVRTLIISAVLVVVIWFALYQLFGTSDPDKMLSEVQRMIRVIF